MRERLLSWMGMIFFVAASVVWIATYSAGKSHSEGLGLLLGGTFFAAWLLALAMSSFIGAAISRRIARLEEQIKKLDQSKDETTQ